MGKDDKEDSGFGFKDRAKAEETLKLLESHDMNYRRLTVRGLLGRAKRVLTLTKAEEKIKNIKEAMSVFEEWLQGLDQGKEKEKKKESPAKKEEEDDEDESPKDKDEDKSKSSDTVPGLGFKDRAAAEGTLQELEGRDYDYQKLAVKGLVGRAKRVLTCTKDTTKISNIKEAIDIFEKFLEDFESKQLSKLNNPYISLGQVLTCLKIAEDRKLAVEHQKKFIEAYKRVDGEYKRLRTVEEKEDGKSWDIVRNDAIKQLKEKNKDINLFKDDEPTDEHLLLLLWAYSPDPSKCKKLIKETKVEKESRKRKSSETESESKKKK